MSHGGKLMPNLDQNSTKLLNLTVLQRIDPFVEEILFTAAHVTLYEFNIDLSQWSRKDVEGWLFVVKRNTHPRFQFQFNLTNGCTEFIESAEQILEKRKMNQTLLNHSTMLDLLEIPQLMDTCVRNGNYDEALDLEAFVCKVSTMHPKIPVIQALVVEVRQTTQSLLSQLIQRLRSNIQLPECLRIIGYLRRIGVFSEYELRLQFLRCWEAWLMGVLDDLDQRNPYEYLKGMVSCYRAHLFDVVNQYRAIFAYDTSGSEENYDGGLLFSWVMHQITSHLKTLKLMLPKLTEGGSLSNILDQCMFLRRTPAFGDL